MGGKINSYPEDQIINPKDSVIGSDYSSKKTWNYPLGRVIYELGGGFFEPVNTSYTFASSSNSNGNDETVLGYFTLDNDDLSLTSQVLLNPSSSNGKDNSNAFTLIDNGLVDNDFVLKIENAADGNEFYYFNIDNITNNTTYSTLDVTSKSSTISGALNNEVLYKVQIQISTDKSLQQSIDTINVDLSSKADLVGGYVTPIQLDKTDALDVNDSNKISTAKASYELKQLVDIAQGNAVNALNQLITVNEELNAIGQPFIPKGAWDASGSLLPANTKVGWTYRITVAGTIDGRDLEIGDTITSLVDNASVDDITEWLVTDNTEQTQTADTVPFTTTSDLSATNSRDAIEEVYQIAQDASINYQTTTYANLASTSGATRLSTEYWNVTDADTDTGITYGKIRFIAETEFIQESTGNHYTI